MITGNFALDWALISVSLFNAILLLWLGLIVLLNTERRTTGLWILNGGLMSGALFFISHTVMLGHDMTTTVSEALNFWWQIGWFPVVLAPYIWHLTVLWYTGFWDNRHTPLRRRHFPGLLITSGLAIGLLLFMLLDHALPSYTQIAYRNVIDVPTFKGIPILFLLYPPFAFLSIILPIDALYRPEPAARMMGDLARRRARPWLIGTSLVLLVVGLLITGFFAWALNGYRVFGGIYFGWENEIAIFDLIISSLIAVAILMLGQALVTYEIFTGKTLPRRGFLWHWRSTNLLAIGYATLASWTLVYKPRPIYSVLLATFLMIVFYALFSWRSFVERERFMAHLRPFVSSQRLMSGLLSAGDDSSSADTLFQAVCADVLSTSHACLIPLGALAPLVGSPLGYRCTPGEHKPHFPPEMFDNTQTSVFPLDAAQNAGLQWAIPLWAERGLIGALLLGPKQDGGLYTHEEIEIARASAERIIDTLAGEQIARRLKDIQQRRFAETKVLDLRTRRTLHDDILPELHMIALQLSALARREPVVSEVIQSLTRVHHQISDLIHTPGGRFVPNGQNGQLVQMLRALLEEEFAEAFDTITWQTTDTSYDLNPLLYEVVFNAVREAVRNAALHGRGDQPNRALNLIINIRRDPTELVVEVCDDGVGMTAFPSRRAAAKSPAGSGGGLILHSTMLAISGGELRVDSPASGGTRVILSVPV